MNKNEGEPNLFDFAPKELSQDAILCWLLSWANPRLQRLNTELHEAGCRLLALLFQKHGLDFPRESSVQVHRQVDHVDILVEVGLQYIVLIEDKTKTKHHGDQLNRYLNNMRAKHPERHVLPVFLKTEDQCDYLDVTTCGYYVCDRSDILSCIWPQKKIRLKSDVLRNFAEYLDLKEESIRSFAVKPVSDWDRGQWVGLYKELNLHIRGLNWDWVSNRAGGFEAAWWGAQKAGRVKMYLQIEECDMCFKIDVNAAEDRSSLRELWHERLMEHGRKSQICNPQRPPRFGSGRTMTVGVVPRNEWLSVDGVGVLNLNETLRHLNAATRLVKRVMRAT